MISWLCLPHHHRCANTIMLKTLLLALLICMPFDMVLAHTPYGQWDSFRDRHLQVMTSRTDLTGDALADQWVAVLAQHLPKSKAVVSRARNFVRVGSLLTTDQAKLAVLSHDQAIALIDGTEPFTDSGPTSIQVLLDNGDYLLVARADLPEDHGFLITATLLEQAEVLNLSVPLDNALGIQIHAGALKALATETDLHGK